MIKTKPMTVYEAVHRGYRMNEAKERIYQALDDADLSPLDRICVLEMMAFEAKAEVIV